MYYLTNLVSKNGEVIIIISDRIAVCNLGDNASHVSKLNIREMDGRCVCPNILTVQ